MKKIPKYQKIREKNYTIIKKWIASQKDVSIVETNQISHSPYIPIIIENPETISLLHRILAEKNIKLKMPYGKDSNPNESEKRNLFAIESGFKDLSRNFD